MDKTTIKDTQGDTITIHKAGTWSAENVYVEAPYVGGSTEVVFYFSPEQIKALRKALKAAIS